MPESDLTASSKNAVSCGSGLVSRKGRKAAPRFMRQRKNSGSATQPFRDTRPLLQGPRMAQTPSHIVRLFRSRQPPK
ncbi:hypothetical protein BTA49_06815 [Pseudomonas mosselii]|nr:hypothetical protein CLJ08_17560 [Pseudomonas mosselii]ORT72263.1 hypothetical protein BTA49_06815 [Pseudomonas mosselii]